MVRVRGPFDNICNRFGSLLGTDVAMNIDAFVAGYRQGRDGLTPTVPDAMAERENEDLESTKPNVNSDPDWAWHLLGWTVGRAVARDETIEMS